MTFENTFNRNAPLRAREDMDAVEPALPPLPKRFLNVPWPDMPEKMLMAIDGWSDTPKTLVGEWVADSLGGLLVNSEKIFHSLVTACSKSGLDVNDHARVASWCEKAAVDVGFAEKGGRAFEAHVAVNGCWFENSDFRGVVESVTNRAAHDAFWGKVRQVLRRCDFDDRVVVVGSDIGFEFPRTPYKFFLDHTGGNRDFTELAGLAYSWLGRRLNYDEAGVTYFDHGLKTLVIDTNRAKAGDIACVVLVESVARACEMGFHAGPLESALEHAYAIADATRRRMNAVLPDL